MAGRQAKILSPDDLHDLLVFASCTRNPLRNRVLVLLSAKAGLRAGEIANLTWSMVTGTLQRYRLTTSRFNWFAASSGAPSHCLLKGSGQGIVEGQTITLEAVGCGFRRRSLSGCPMSALGQKRT